MKKFFNIFFAAVVAALAVMSCQKEQDNYTPGTPDPDGCYGVYFPTQDASGSHTYDPSMDRSVTITVSRTNTSGAIEVPFTYAASVENVFQFGTISFADGQSETDLVVTFPNAEEGKELSFSVQLNDDNTYVSHYNSGAIALDFSVLIVNWEYFLNPVTGEKALFTFEQGYWGETAFAYVKYYEVNGVRTCVTESTGQHIYNEPYEGFGFFGAAEAEGEGEMSFRMYMNEFNSEGYNFVELLPTEVYVNSNYGQMVYVFDYYYFWTIYQDSLGNSQGITATWLEFAKKYEANYPMGYYDGNGGLYFYTRSYGMYGLGGWTSDYVDIIGVAEGFTRTDYSLEVSTDYTDSEGVTPIYVEAGKDVKEVHYAVYEGELNSAQLEARTTAIWNGTENVQTFSDFVLDEEEDINYGAFGVSPDKTGPYTVVLVAFSKESVDNKGEAIPSGPQTSASVVINHVAAGDVADLSVNISVFTEPTPARYSSLTEYDSFAYYVVGKDITDAHIGVYPSNKVTESALSTLKYDGASVDAAVLDAINAEGGYYDVVGSLDPGTEYCVVVWATNGSMDTFAYEYFETTPSPEVWNTVGTAVWTDVFFGPWFGADPVSYEVELQESEDTPGRFRLVNVYGEAFPYNEPGDWDDSKDYYLVINADDPDMVWTETFDTGCNWGYGDFLLGSDAGLYVSNGYSIEEIKEAYKAGEDILFGKLENNVITFPVDAMLKAMANYNNGAWYYGNHTEEFTIQLNITEAADAPKAAKAAHVSKNFSGNGVKAIHNVFGKMVFERDPQAVDVKTVSMAPVRREKEVSSFRNSRPVLNDRPMFLL